MAKKKKAKKPTTVAEAKGQQDELDKELEDIGTIPPEDELPGKGPEDEPKGKSGKILTPLDTADNLDEVVPDFRITAEHKEGFIAADEKALKRTGRKGRSTTQIARDKRVRPVQFTVREALARYRKLTADLDSPNGLTDEQAAQAKYEIDLLESGKWRPQRNQQGGLVFPKAPAFDKKTRRLVEALTSP